MPNITTATLTRFFNQAEVELSIEQPFLVDRYSIPTVAGTKVYTLPDYVASIKRITYLGMKLDPLPQRNFREVFQSATQQGKPFWYIFNKVGLNQIQLFPTPSQTIAQAVTGLWDTAIPTSVIVEFYRVSDNNTFIVQPYLRQQLLKNFVAKMCATIEGGNQNLKVAKYFSDKWEQLKAGYFAFNRELYASPRKLIVDQVVSNNYFPGSPVLPIDRFGISVDTGY